MYKNKKFVSFRTFSFTILQETESNATSSLNGFLYLIKTKLIIFFSFCNRRRPSFRAKHLLTVIFTALLFKQSSCFNGNGGEFTGFTPDK